VKHKIVAAVLAVLLVLTGIAGGIAGAGAESVEPYVRMTLSSAYIGDYEEYHLAFLLGKAIASGSTLTVGFDDDVNHSRVYQLTTDMVLVDGKACSGLSWTGHALTVTVPLDLTAGTEHTIVILPAAMIQNPWTAMGIRCTLSDDARGTVLTSNYVMVSAQSGLSGISLSTATTTSGGLDINIRFKTGRNGALKGTAATWSSVTSLTSYNDTITIRLSHTLSMLWNECDSPTVLLSTPPYGLGARQLRIVSSTLRNEDDSAAYQRVLTFIPDVDIPASTEILMTVELDGVKLLKPLTTDDTAAVWTSKESAMITLVPDGALPPDPSGTTGTTPVSDTTPPAVVWTSKADALLPRLVTVGIVITEENLDDAWFARDADGVPDTHLSTGDNTVMLINRNGIHGTIVAVDKAGNRTSVPVDISAPSAS
jgi:hypothetical protein